jgi:hypothetical protein
MGKSQNEPVYGFEDEAVGAVFAVQGEFSGWRAFGEGHLPDHGLVRQGGVGPGLVAGGIIHTIYRHPVHAAFQGTFADTCEEITMARQSMQRSRLRSSCVSSPANLIGG